MKSTARHFLAFAVEQRGRFLVRQRPAGVVNPHLWEFPNLQVTGWNGNLTEVARACLGFAPGKLEALMTIKHTITRYRITLNVFAAKVGSSMTAKFGTWRKLGELEALAFPSAHRRIVAKLQKSAATLGTGFGAGGLLI